MSAPSTTSSLGAPGQSQSALFGDIGHKVSVGLRHAAYLLRQPVELYERRRMEIAISGLEAIGEPLVSGRVLVDGIWDNPNYWLRYGLLRAAVGLSDCEEIGLVGEYATDRCRRTFERLGFSAVHDERAWLGDPAEARQMAETIIEGLSRPEEILDWALPHNILGEDFYDAMLSRQRRGVVDISDPRLVDYLTDYLRYVEAAARLLDDVKPDMLIITHTASQNHFSGPLTLLAIQRDIPIIVPWGIYGTPRPYRIGIQSDIYDFADRPTGDDIDALEPEQADTLAHIGRAYLDARFGGLVDDHAARAAYGHGVQELDRTQLAAEFGWDPDAPIVAVYASVWFDNPHSNGMREFRDFVEWISLTVETAQQIKGTNWLLRAHPSEDWYGGETLADLFFDNQTENVRLCPKSWSGSALRKNIDALITYQGTAGIEYSASNVPVMIADKAWYHDAGFVYWPDGRDNYLAALRRHWWRELDLDNNRRRAEIFSGWYFCCPDWQGSFRLMDDADPRISLYRHNQELLKKGQETLTQELATMRRWFMSGERKYHRFKMREGGPYRLPFSATP